MAQANNGKSINRRFSFFLTIGPAIVFVYEDSDLYIFMQSFSHFERLF
jgi:hypothetical protein